MRAPLDKWSEFQQIEKMTPEERREEVRKKRGY
jgi:hypothetical protein